MPWVSLVIGIILTLFIIAIVILNTDFFAHAIGGMFSRYLFHGTTFSLEVDKLSGNPLKELKLSNLRIRYRGKDFSFDVLRIEEIYCRFGILSLLKKEPYIDELILVNPHVWIKSEGFSTFTMPKPPSSKVGLSNAGYSTESRSNEATDASPAFPIRTDAGTGNPFWAAKQLNAHLS